MLIYLSRFPQARLSAYVYLFIAFTLYVYLQCLSSYVYHAATCNLGDDKIHDQLLLIYWLPYNALQIQIIVAEDRRLLALAPSCPY